MLVLRDQMGLEEAHEAKQVVQPYRLPKRLEEAEPSQTPSETLRSEMAQS